MLSMRLLQMQTGRMCPRDTYAVDEHPVNVDPATVQPLTLLPPAFVTKAVDPEIAIPTGTLKPVPPLSEHPVNVDPATVHALTVEPK